MWIRPAQCSLCCQSLPRCHANKTGNSIRTIATELTGERGNSACKQAGNGPCIQQPHTHVQSKHYPPTRKGNLTTPVSSNLVVGVNLRVGMERGVYFLRRRQPVGMSSIYHSCLAAAARQAHPSPFPAPCRHVCSTKPALINLITSCKMDLRPIYLSANPLL